MTAVRAAALTAAVVALGCGDPPRRERLPAPAAAPAPPPAATSPAPAPRPAASDLRTRAETLLRDTGSTGAVVAIDVATGEVLASVAIGQEVAAPVLPLSVIKLYLAALWWNHGHGDETLRDPRAGDVTAHDMLVNGYDRPGMAMAVSLRRSLGGGAVLGELRALGLGEPPGALTLPADADDATWGRALSIGEDHVTVTLLQVARLCRAIGASDAALVTADTARRLRDGMRGAVAHGTASAAAPMLAGTGWQLGGKTGTGPDVVGPTSDGWFAGLAFEGDQPRLAIAVFVADRGPGGGVAARIAAEVTRPQAAP